jgi:hypothetical protein
MTTTTRLMMMMTMDDVDDSLPEKDPSIGKSE